MKAKKTKQRKGKLNPKKKRKQNFLMFDILKISQRILIESLIHQNISFVVVSKKMKEKVHTGNRVSILLMPKKPKDEQS
jgi:predicted transcriptional regulator